MISFKRFTIILFLLLLEIGIVNGKNFVIQDITYLPYDRTATEPETLVEDSNGDVCAIIKLSFPKVDDSVIAGDQVFKKEYHGSEWYIYMPPNTYQFYIKYGNGYEDLVVDLSDKFKNGVESGKTYRVVIPYNDDIKGKTELTEITVANGSKISVKAEDAENITTVLNEMVKPIIEAKKFLKPTSIYFQAGYTILGLSGMNIGVGGYIKNFNIEANYLIGFSKSGDIYWNDSSGDSMPVVANYSPMGCDFKVGYGILIGNRFRLTPQLGIQYVALSESADKKVANNANAMNLPIGVKAELAIVRHFAISLEPAYNINVSKSEGYKVLSEISSKIKGYSDGFGINVSLNVNF